MFLVIQWFISMKKISDFNSTPIVADVTIRDGGYLNDWNFPVETIRTIVRYLDRCGMDIIEVGYLSDDESKPPAARCTASYLEMLSADIRAASIAGMLSPKKHKDPVAVLASRKGHIDLVRIPTFVEDVDFVIQIVKDANELGIRCSMNLISFTAYTDSELLGAVEKIASSGEVELLYFADSRGSVYPDALFALYSDVRQIWKAPLGFHAHDNLGLAIENCQAALAAGCNLIDCSINGYGLGGRNTDFVETIDLVRDLRPDLPDVDRRELETVVEAMGMPPKEEFHDLYYQSGLKNLEQEWCPILWETYGDSCFELLERLPRSRYKEIDEVLEFAELVGIES